MRPFGAALAGSLLLGAATALPAIQEGEIQEGERPGPPERREDNSLCHVCHLDLRTEAIAISHLAAGVTCTGCHGPSVEHMHDEMLMTKPDRLFGRAEVDEMCGACHPPGPSGTVHGKPEAVEAFRKEWLGRTRPNGRVITSAAVCTDCHGTHNIVKEMAGRADEPVFNEWFPLFNGDDLDGWRAAGGAEWKVEGNRLRATLAAGRVAGELWTDAVYEDYLLTATFRAEWPVRAGIWLRGTEAEPGPRVEIRESLEPRVSTGSLWIPGKGLAVTNLSEDLVTRETWNTISVVARGPQFRVILNGVEVGAARLEVPDAGRIGLHLEGHPDREIAELTFSELRLQRLVPLESLEPKEDDLGDEAVALFNGVDLAGWEAIGGARWTVEDGLLVGTQGDANAPGDLLTTDDYEDYLLRVVYRTEWPCNSGVWFRYQSASQSYQADILEYANPECYAGSLYCTGKMFLALNKDKSIVDREGWNTMLIEADGDRIRTWINGYAVADVRDDTSATGRIGFQIHPGAQFGPMRIVVREVLMQPR